MPLLSSLTSNEVKNASGVEVEFTGYGAVGRSKEYQSTTELPAYPHRIRLDHQTSGVGVNKIRRSRLGVYLETSGAVDITKKAIVRADCVVTFPEGNQSTTDVLKLVLANLISLLASTGADTVVKFDCTGNGADALLKGYVP